MIVIWYTLTEIVYKISKYSYELLISSGTVGICVTLYKRAKEYMFQKSRKTIFFRIIQSNYLCDLNWQNGNVGLNSKES